MRPSVRARAPKNLSGPSSGGCPRRIPKGWAADVVRRTCWDDDAMAHVACGDAFAMPKFHRITASFVPAQEAAATDGNRPRSQEDDLKADIADFEAQIAAQDDTPAKDALLAAIADRLAALAPPPQCRWTFIASTPDGSEPAPSAPVQAPCSEAVSFDVPYPHGGRLRVQADDGASVATDVVVEDIFILGLGDSFASGEGNPDVPVRFNDARQVIYGPSPDDDPLDGYPARVGDWERVGDEVFQAGRAHWLSRRCHRSLYGHQARAALQLAIEAPHRAVTFVGFACAGGEIIAGLFRSDVGTPWLPERPGAGQLSFASQAQCVGDGEARLPVPRLFATAFGLEGRLPELQQIVLPVCPKESARRFDLVFLSIGGNDVGFSSLVANAVLSSRSTLASMSGWMGRLRTAEETRAQFPDLALRYKALRRAFHSVLHLPHGEGDRVILTGYPPLTMRDERGRVCPDGTWGMDVYPAFEMSEARVAAAESVADDLNDLMRDAARAHGWTFVDAHRAAFVGRGVCDAAFGALSGSADDLRFPRFRDGVWAPYAPSRYQPYASRRRWVRNTERCLSDGALSRRSIAGEGRAGDGAAQLVPARARQHLLGCLPPDCRRPCRNRGRRCAGGPGRTCAIWRGWSDLGGRWQRTIRRGRELSLAG